MSAHHMCVSHCRNSRRTDYKITMHAIYHHHPLRLSNPRSDGSLHITKSNGVMETRALCEQINKQTPTEMMSVVHYTTGW